MSRAGLYLPEDSYIDTGYTTDHTTLCIRCKVRPATQTAADPNIVTKKGYFAAAFNDFPWDLRWSAANLSFNSLHDRGNDFSADSTLQSRVSPINYWWDVVSIHAGTKHAMWVAPAWALDAGYWQITTAPGNLASGSGRNIRIGRAPFEQSGGVGETGFTGEIAHLEIWSIDISTRFNQMRDWRPPMRATQTAPSGLIMYLPFDDTSGAASARNLVSGSTMSITGTHEWRRGFTNPYRDRVRKQRKRVAL